MIEQKHQESIDQAMGVLEAHFAALNARDEKALAKTLHFPHYRLASGRLQIWPEADGYLADFYARTTDDWHHSVLDNREIIAAASNKVHMNVTFTRCREDGSSIGTYRSLWVLASIDGCWAAQLRSSFAA